jgi:hypothetical protein
METNQIRDELFKAVDRSNGWQSLRHLMLKLKKEDPSRILDALLGIFFEDSDRDNPFADQEAAGGLLWKLKPRYERFLKDDIKRSLRNWNVSVEELPWYLAKECGIENVREEVKLLLAESLDQTSKIRADTYLYWLRAINPEEFMTSLDRRWNGRLRG